MTSSEKEFYRDAGVQVTNARFITPGQTIAMSGITAVSTYRHGLSRGEWLTLVFGLLLLYWGKDTHSLLLLGLSLVAYVIWAFLNPVYSLHLTSSSGKKRMLATRAKNRIFAIAGAVNEAIIHRA